MALQDLIPTRSATSGRAVWPLLLLAAAVASSFTFACVTPFVAFAVLAAATMKPRPALGMMAAIWLANQALGFGFMNYPVDTTTLLWGAAIGVAALAATGAAAAAGPRGSWRGIVFGFAAALAVYEGLLFLASLVLGGSANFSLGIVGRVALSDATWLLGLAILRHFLLRAVALSRESRRPVTT